MFFYPIIQNAANVGNHINGSIKMQGTTVDYVSSYLYLEVYIENMVTFKNIIQTLLSHKLYVLRKIRYTCTR